MNTKSFVSSLLNEKNIKKYVSQTSEFKSDDDDTLIELYFESDNSEERDILFEELCSRKSKHVNTFLLSMIDSDEDTFLQLQAATELAYRNYAQGLKRLHVELENTDDTFVFQYILNILVEVEKPEFYDTLKKMWLNNEYYLEKRFEIIQAMELLDSSKAMDDFLCFIENITDISTIIYEEVEIILLLFIRNKYDKAKKRLEKWIKKIDFSHISKEEKDDFLNFIQSNITLLNPI